MRSLLIIYSVLTMFFTGGCALLFSFVDKSVSFFFLVPFLCNTAFLWMAVRRVRGGLLVVAGSLYAVVELIMNWYGGLFDQSMKFILTVLALIAAKTAVVVCAGLVMRRRG